ncbi:MAG: Rrf2-linked NADH-flavin reductase, partial [uncultured Blastococcus sp.]
RRRADRHRRRRRLPARGRGRATAGRHPRLPGRLQAREPGDGCRARRPAVDPGDPRLVLPVPARRLRRLRPRRGPRHLPRRRRPPADRRRGELLHRRLRLRHRRPRRDRAAGPPARPLHRRVL